MSEVVCPHCEGQGSFREAVVAGFVSHEMAMDACDMAYEGQPIYQDVDLVCNLCNGSGTVTEDEAEEYKGKPA